MGGLLSGRSVEAEICHTLAILSALRTVINIVRFLTQKSAEVEKEVMRQTQADFNSSCTTTVQPPRQCLPSKLKHQPTQEVQLLAMLWRIVCGGLSCSSAVVPLVDSCLVLVLSWIISGVLSHGQIL